MRVPKVLYITYDGVLEPIAQSQALSYIKELRKRGLKFYLLSFEKRENLSDSDYLSAIERDLKEKGITWLRLRYHSSPKLLSTFFDVMAGVLFCFPVVWKNKIRIVHARSEVAAAIAFVISHIFRTKFIYDRRGIMAYDYTEGGMWPKNSVITKMIFTLVNTLDKRFLLFSDYTVVLTQKVAERLKGDFLKFKKKLKIKVIPCCVDLSRFKYIERDVTPLNELSISNKFILLYIGSFGTWNMLREMVDFFVELKKNKQNAHLLIITLSNHNFVENIIKEASLNIEDCTIIGKKFSDIPDYVALADAAVMFRTPVFSQIASCPTKFGEYLACGLPVVINSGIGDTEEIITNEKVGVVVDEFSEDAYQKAAKQLIQLLSEEDVLRQNCRAVAEKYFSLADGVEKYWQVYQNILKR